MIKAIVTRGDLVHFFREDGTIEVITVTRDNWALIYDWLLDVTSQFAPDGPTWTLKPLWSSSGGFIAQKLVT